VHGATVKNIWKWNVLEQIVVSRVSVKCSQTLKSCVWLHFTDTRDLPTQRGCLTWKIVVLSHNTVGVQQFVIEVLEQSLVLVFLALKILKDSNATEIIHF